MDDQEAQTMAEYVILLGVITFGIVATISLMSGAVVTVFQLALDGFS